MFLELSIGIPMFNEQGNVFKIERDLIPELKRLNLTAEILVVNDGSTDQTVELLEQTQHKFPLVRVLHHKKNLGLGAAVSTLAQNAKGNFLILLDGDFSYKPSELSLLLNFRNDFDIVSGSPYYSKHLMYDVPLFRKILSVGINTIYSILLRKKLTCYTGIFRCYRISTLKKIKIKSTGFVAIAEILIKLLRQNATIKEVPVTLYSREFGQPKINTLREIQNHLKLIFSIITGRFS